MAEAVEASAKAATRTDLREAISVRVLVSVGIVGSSFCRSVVYGVATQLLPERDDFVLPFKGWSWTGKEWTEGQLAEEQSSLGVVSRE
jgi:hypothetical protein